MPINLTNISASPTAIYAPNWFDSKITGKGKTRGLLCIDKNPNMIPANTPETFSLPRTNRKRTMRNGNIEISVFPMNIYTDDSYNILKTLPIPDRKQMCLAATNSKNTIYFNIAANAIAIEKTDVTSTQANQSTKTTSTIEYRLEMYITNDTDTVTTNADEIGKYSSWTVTTADVSQSGSICLSCKTCNPIKTINGIISSMSTIPWRAKEINDWVQNLSAYEIVCKQSELWQTQTAKHIDALAAAVVNSNVYTQDFRNRIFVSEIRRLEGYGISLDIYKDIYDCLKKHFSEKDVSFFCKQNLNLLMSDTLNHLESQKSSLQHINTPQNDTFNWTPYSPEQKLAIKSEAPLVLVQAGAGTGKSHAILGRIDYMCNIGIDPKDIMVLSFTNAAADNIKAKNPNVHSMTIARMIHTIYEANFPTHMLSSIDTIRNAIDIYYPNFDTRPTYISDFKRCLTAIIKNDSNAFTRTNNFIEEHYDEVMDILDTIKQTSLELEIIICYQSIDKLNEPAEVASKYLIIDEVQDNSIFEFIYTLKYVDKHKESLFIVGDSSQTLYEFRASNPKALNIMESSGVFETFRLQTNYRSKQDILTFANVLLRNIEANQFANIQLHANSLAKITKTSFQKNVKLKYCQLRKQGDFHDVFDSLMTQHVKRYIDSKTKYNEPVAFLAYKRDTINQIQTWLNEHYPDKKIANLVPDRLKNQTLLSHFIKNYWDEAKFMPTQTIVTDIGREIKLKLGYINRKNSAVAEQLALKAIYNWQTHADPIVNAWLKQYANGQLTKDEILNMIKEDMISYEINTNAIRQSVLSAKNEQNKQQNIDDADFILSTIHSAKGLEFPNTVVIYKDENNMGEEEKRMYYVALTRAMQSEFILAYNTVKSPQIEADYNAIINSLSQPAKPTP